ncbi:hypothetical protein [Noviherbaspirillum denitrificans]|uniref:Uncharacterized protein n=1 Tax=Noviherbaspirillum denitrificans TaxID=1968433 RepID=A0A254TEP1_9BURK|nr:hypothetical protein [Noviherbaspirillum denitrificans]OWW21005.1 hypothetical protein AYR66_17525 [Noviherbaspirillum denitrificans]
MASYQSPTKEQVRAYLARRFASSGPVPSISEIRNELGWIKRPSASGTPLFQVDMRWDKGQGAG